MFHGAPQLEGALHPQLGQSGHPGRKTVTMLQEIKHHVWVGKVSDSPESLPGCPRVCEVTAQHTYFWRQSSSDTNDHLLLIVVHSHIERRFINLEKIHYCKNQVRHSCLIILLLRAKEAEQPDRLCLMGKDSSEWSDFLAVANISVQVAEFLDGEIGWEALGSGKKA